MPTVGVVTRNEEEAEWPEFDDAFYEVKDVSGRQNEPLGNAVNMVSCFGDNAAAAGEPDLVPVNPEGQPANRDRPYFDWAYVDPTHDRYREGLLEIVEECAAANADVRLDDVAVRAQVARDPERLEQTVHAGVLRVGESDLDHERPDGLPAGDRGAQSGLPTDVVGAVDADDQRGHVRTEHGSG